MRHGSLHEDGIGVSMAGLMILIIRALPEPSLHASPN
jgi:hypothetical protein